MRRGTLASIIVIAIAMAATASAQFGRGGGRNVARLATAADFDSGFQFCRIVFRQGPGGDGGGWGVDYPKADQNLSHRLRELTRTPVSLDAGGTAKHLLVRFTDPELFSCPFVMMTEPGGAFLDDQEAAGLLAYVRKGGFLWADDFWGEYAWSYWVTQLRKALPADEFPIFDLPATHPLMNAQFQTKVMQIPSIGWTYSGSTSERGADSAVAHARGIADKHGRLVMLMTHNTDYGDSWEREGDDPQYFYNFGPGGYALAINTVLYAMTH